MGILPTGLIHNQLKTISLVSQKQEAIADNIANMHTTGYKRKDVDFSQLLNSGISSSLESKIVEKFGPTPSFTNNTNTGDISVEDEMAIMQRNYLCYAAATRQLSSTITQIKTALNVSASG